MKRLLLYGGTFDPPHNGHRNNLQAAAKRCRPDEIIVMPAGIPPHKEASATSGELRLAMCQCFVQAVPGVKVTVSDWEICRQGRSYTINTMEMLHQTHPDARLYLAVGSDMLLGFTQWYRWRDLLRLATLVVQSRTGDDIPALHTAAKDLREAGGRVLFAGAAAVPCASSEIRQGDYALAQLQQMVAPETFAVMQQYHLYNILYKR